MNFELADQISLIAAPIYAALMRGATVEDLESRAWQKAAHTAAIRQALALRKRALEMPASDC